jgi:hypothetical protein
VVVFSTGKFKPCDRFVFKLLLIPQMIFCIALDLCWVESLSFHNKKSAHSLLLALKIRICKDGENFEEGPKLQVRKGTEQANDDS